VTRLGFAVNDGNLKKYESGVNNIKNSAEQAANSFRNMFAAFIGISALKSIVNTADHMQSLQARIGMLPQTVGEAADAFDSVAKKATESRTSVEAYGTLYVRLAGATKDFLTTQEDVLQVTSAISDALIVGGATAMEASSATLQLSQAFQKGKLDGDEFRAFMETMSTDLKTKLAEQLGAKDAGDLFEMSKSGKLTAKNLALAFKNLAPVIRKQMLQIPMTFGQATTIIGNKWDEFINRMNRKSGAITSIAKFMLEGVDWLEKKMYELVNWLGGATQALKLFGIILAAAFAPMAIGLFAGALAALFSPITLIFGALVLLGLILEDVYQYFTGGESVLGDFIEWLNEGSVAALALKTIFVMLTAVLSALAVGFLIAWVAALSGPMLIIAGILLLYTAFVLFKDQIAELFSSMWDAGLASFYTMVDSIKAGLDSVKSFFGFGASVTPATAAGAATSAGGTGSTATAQQSVTINQTLPPGTTPETAAAAKAGTQQAMAATDNGQLARQMGQLQ